MRSSDSDPKLICKHQEQLEHEKKTFEDLEFQLMEGNRPFLAIFQSCWYFGYLFYQERIFQIFHSFSNFLNLKSYFLNATSFHFQKFEATLDTYLILLFSGEAHNESEKDEILQEIRFLESQIAEHEEKLNEIDQIQSQLLSEEFKSKQEYQLLKKSLNRSIAEESEKLVTNFDMISSEGETILR